MAAPKSWAKVAWGRACRVLCPPDMPARAVWACTVGSGHGNLARGDLEAGGVPTGTGPEPYRYLRKGW